MRLPKKREPIKWEIIHGEELPPRRFFRNEPKYLFSLMDVGGTVLLNREAEVVRKALMRFAKKYPDWRFSVRKQTKNSCKVWRIA